MRYTAKERPDAIHVRELGSEHTRSSSNKLRDRSRLRKRLSSVSDMVNVAFILMGPVLFTLALCIFLFYAYMYFAAFQSYVGLSHDNAHGLLTTVVGLWILFNILFNHCMAAFVSPGNAPEEAEYPAEVVQALLLEEMEQLERRDSLRPKGQSHHNNNDKHGGIRTKCFCAKCLIRKPKRAHHCGVCQRCVLRMDHHCPWIANCVGAHNYRYFLSFLIYLFLGCVYVICVLQKAMFHSDVSDPEYNRLIFMCWLVAFATMFPVAAMLGFHLFLVGTNQTTIEMLGNVRERQEAKRQGKSWSNPFNRGIGNNLREVFGENVFPFSWLVPMQNVFQMPYVEYNEFVPASEV